ncbi:MAG TPA: hypothetical protein VGL94_07965, partial [Ktedonobacteraceae bacterium]
MNTSFSSKCGILLIKRAITLLILSAIAAEFFGIPLQAYAQMPQTQLKVSQAFKDFCPLYYNKIKDSNAKQDTQICQKMGDSFSSLLMQDSPNGYTFWPAQATLDILAQKGYLMDSQTLTRVQTPQDFVNTIRTNPDLQALVSGSGNINKGIPHNSTFLPALWDYNEIFIDQAISPTCTSISLNYFYSDTWPFVGPELLKETSQELIHTTGIQKTYNALLTSGHCSLAALTANMTNPNSTYQADSTKRTTNISKTYQLEKKILATVQSRFQDSQIHDVSPALAWIMAQKNPMLVDDWVSFAILTNPNA